MILTGSPSLDWTGLTGFVDVIHYIDTGVNMFQIKDNSDPRQPFREFNAQTRGLGANLGRKAVQKPKLQLRFQFPNVSPTSLRARKGQNPRPSSLRARKGQNRRRASKPTCLNPHFRPFGPYFRPFGPEILHFRPFGPEIWPFVPGFRPFGPEI